MTLTPSDELPSAFADRPPTARRMATYSLVGSVALRVDGPAALRSRIEPFLPREDRSGVSATHGSVDVTLRPGARAVPGDPLLRHLVAELRRAPGGRLGIVAPGISVAAEGASAEVRVDASAPAHALRAALELTWPLLLARLGLYRVHCAAVRDPEGRGWLLVGDSGVGKSTSALALVKSGWSYASDDAAYVSAGGAGRLLAHGWPEPARITPRSAQALGFRYVPVTSGRGLAEPETSLQTARIDRVEVQRVIFPELGAVTAIRALARGEAVARLIRASPWVACDSEHAPTYLACLARAALLPAAQLVLGPELLEAPTRLAEHFRASPLWGAPTGLAGA